MAGAVDSRHQGARAAQKRGVDCTLPCPVPRRAWAVWPPNGVFSSLSTSAGWRQVFLGRIHFRKVPTSISKWAWLSASDLGAWAPPKSAVTCCWCADRLVAD
jgi:hypothetical protein